MALLDVFGSFRGDDTPTIAFPVIPQYRKAAAILSATFAGTDSADMRKLTATIRSEYRMADDPMLLEGNEWRFRPREQNSLPLYPILVAEWTVPSIRGVPMFGMLMCAPPRFRVTQDSIDIDSDDGAALTVDLVLRPGSDVWKRCIEHTREYCRIYIHAKMSRTPEGTGALVNTTPISEDDKTTFKTYRFGYPIMVLKGRTKQ